MTECVDEEDEWILSTCYSRTNRLRSAGIANKHAGIQGMPKMDLEEKEAIMRVLMELKGKGTKKHRDAHAK